jgi:tRNA U34 5-carboxymethylaminomethyl modifying enzyme MnmG/GidA
VQKANNLLKNDWDQLDISNLDYAVMRPQLSNEDYERLTTYKPQTLSAAKRAGIKQAAMLLIYNQSKKNGLFL